MRSTTPLADRLLPDAFRQPPGLAPFVRSLEERAGALLAQAEVAMRSTTTPTRLLTEVRDALSRFLDSSEHGTLVRFLRRPMRQLSPQAVSGRMVQRAATILFERAERAMAVQDAVNELCESIQGLRARYEEHFPNLLREHMHAAALENDNLRTATSLAALRTLTARSERVGARLASLIDSHAVREALRYVEEHEEEREAVSEALQSLSVPRTMAELVAVDEHRRRLRRAAVTHDRLEAHATRLLAHHVSDLRSLAPTGAREPSALQIVVEEIANRVVEMEHLCANDAELWLVLLDRASAAASPVRSDHGWIVELLGPEVPTEQGGYGATAAVFPIDDRLAVIRQRADSPLRVWSHGPFGAGETLRVRAVGKRALTLGARLANEEVAPFFSGIDGNHGGWYTTTRAATVRPLCKIGSEWYCQLLRKGRLGRTPDPAWRTFGTTPQALRIAVEDNHTAAEPIEVGDPTPSMAFAGGVWREVATPLYRYRRALFRTLGVPGATATALDDEAAVLQALHRVGSRNAPALIGSARLAETAEEGMLYSVQAAVPSRAGGAGLKWLRASPEQKLSTLCRLVRLMQAVHECGYNLGLYHLSAFAFMPRWKRLTSESVLPVPTVMHALAAHPLDTLHGEQRITDEHNARFENLRFRGGIPISSDAIVTKSQDAQRLAVLGLDLLAFRPILATRGWIDFPELQGAIQSTIHCAFDAPDVARILANTLDQPERCYEALIALTDDSK